MGRPRCCRRVSASPLVGRFGPTTEPSPGGEEIVLTLDEYEAIRLADLEGLYHEAAAATMGVSRATFGRIVETAHRKVAQALVHATTLSIQGGPVAVGSVGGPQCQLCLGDLRDGLLDPCAGTGCHQAPCCERKGRDSCPGDSDPEECARIRRRKNCRHLARSTPSTLD